MELPLLRRRGGLDPSWHVIDCATQSIVRQMAFCLKATYQFMKKL